MRRHQPGTPRVMRQSQNNGLAAMAPANTVIVAATAATAVAVILLSLASLKKRYRGDASKPPAGYSTNVPKNSTTARADGADSRLVLAIDIGSSSVRCSAYAIGADGEGGGRWDEVIVVPGSAAQIVRKIVQDDGCADATVVLKLVDQAMDQCVGCVHLLSAACSCVFPTHLYACVSALRVMNARLLLQQTSFLLVNTQYECDGNYCEIDKHYLEWCV